MRSLIRLLIPALLCGLCGLSCAGQTTQPQALPDGLYAEFSFGAGTVVCELFSKQTPITVTNFVGLVEGTLGPKKDGKSFFEEQLWGRVERGFVVTGGTTKDAGYKFVDECVPGLRHDAVGILEMGNDGPDDNASEIVLMLGAAPHLNYNHTVFGKTVRGLEVLPLIKLNEPMKIKIVRVGAEARGFRADQAAFDAALKKGKTFEGEVYPGPSAYLDDPDKLFGDPKAYRARDFNTKLGNFYRFAGVRVMARVFAKMPAEAGEGAGDKFNEYLRALAAKAGVEKSGAMIVYFQDRDQWAVRVGNESIARFIAGPLKADGTLDPVAKEKTLEQSMREYLALGTRARRPGGVPAAELNAPATGPATQPRGTPRPASQFDPMMDQLFYRLEAVPKRVP